MRSVSHIIKTVAKSLIFESKKMERPFTVIVEGNIGCGKTTFLNHFNKYDGVCTLAEPVDLWRNVDGHNLLALMYEDPKQWSFTFQSYVQLTMLQNHLKATNCPIKILERSLYSARYCFVEKLCRDNLLAAASATVLDRWFQWAVEKNNVEVDLVVYLRSSPEVVYERMLKRNRPEEKTISIEFLKSLHQIHEDWLFNKTLHQCPAPTLVLNADLDRSIIKNEYDRWQSHILNKIPQHASSILKIY